MLLHRIGKTKYAYDLKGEGAKINGGRWNYEGISCIYTADSRALALLEYTVHSSIDAIPRALSFTTFIAPDASVIEFKISDLTGNWSNWPHPRETREFGSELLKKQEYLLLKFPSAILPFEFNFIINPLHPLMNEVKIIDVVNY